MRDGFTSRGHRQTDDLEFVVRNGKGVLKFIEILSADYYNEEYYILETSV
jgi:hypothetical protein